MSHAMRLLVLLLACASPMLARAAIPTACPGDPIAPTAVVTGTFPASLEGAYVMVPFTVPPKTTQVRVKYCWDQPESGSQRHTIDLGLWDARRGGETWERKQFRGW